MSDVAPGVGAANVMPELLGAVSGCKVVVRPGSDRGVVQSTPGTPAGWSPGGEIDSVLLAGVHGSKGPGN
mgnify:FL=1